MKLTNRIIANLYAALHDLDGLQKPDGTIEVRYVFGAKVLYSIARSINHLKGAVEAFDKAKRTIIAQHSGGKAGVSPSDVAFMQCQTDVEVLLDQEVEVELHRVKLDDLNLDKNQLRPTTLAAMEPLILPD